MMFQFNLRKIVPIENPTFDLAAAVRMAHERGSDEGDPVLASPPPDPRAAAFWMAAATQSSFSGSGSEVPAPPPAERPSFALPSRAQSDGASWPSRARSDQGEGPALESRPLKRVRVDEEIRSARFASNQEDEPKAAANLKRSRADSTAYHARGKRKNVRVHLKRRKRLDADAPVHGDHPTRPEIVEAHVKNAKSYQTDLHAEALPATTCGYIARSKTPGDGIYFMSLKEVLDLGHRLIEWDGVTAMPLVCSEGRIFAVLVGRIANDPTYDDTCRLAYEAITQEGREAQFTEAETHHRRGDFPAVNVGVTMGLGATYPTNLGVGAHADMLKRLLGNEHINRLANFADSAFNLWAPNVHRHYRERLDPLFDERPYLEPIFPRSVFPAAAFNFGGNVCTKSHRDSMNSAIGWCAIFGLGPYNPKQGGHLVLPDLKLVIEFPPGSLIMIPSATLTHANLPVAFGDSRVSFTQYCGGGLIRYVDNGYRTEAELRKKDRKKYTEMVARKATRWEDDLKLYDLLKDRVTPVQARVEGTSDS